MNRVIKKANSLYKKSQESTGLCRAVKRGNLEKALRLYRGQLKEIRNGVELSALMRNIAMTNFRLAEVVEEGNETTQMNLVVYYLKEAVSEFTKALSMRPGSIGSEWGNGILDRMSECFDVGFTRIGCSVPDVEQTRKKSNSMNKLFQELPETSDFAECFVRSFLTKAQFSYNCSINCLERNDFIATAQFLEDAREAVENAKKYCEKNKDLEYELELMEKDIFIYSCCCESVRIRHQADALFTEYVHHSEDLNMEMMWDILDMYKDAVLKTQERDLENEALAISRMGRMFDKIFKLQCKGHSYYRRAFDLAQTMLPRDLNKMPWFLECKNGIERYQRRILGEEQWKEYQERKPILEKLEKELDELKKASENHERWHKDFGSNTNGRNDSNKSIDLIMMTNSELVAGIILVLGTGDSYNLLRYVYSKYPPKVSYTFKEKELDSSTLNSFLRKASIHYHPDKQVKFGLEWKVLCGEISKYINAGYSRMKDCEP